jgi:hypothetical protein
MTDSTNHMAYATIQDTVQSDSLTGNEAISLPAMIGLTVAVIAVYLLSLIVAQWLYGD